MAAAGAACGPSTVTPSGGGACLGGAPTLLSGQRIPVTQQAIENVDILFVIDNSNTMPQYQETLTRGIGTLFDQLTSPPVDPATMRPLYAPVKSLHVGVVSISLGTPGSIVPSCANSDAGDDGLLNPIRNGLAIRTYQPWTTAPPGRRPARCTNDPNQFPSFLTFDAMTSDPAVFREEFICNAYLSVGGCGLEQQLEAAYRALVIHNPRMMAGNTDPNAGFVRDNAVLSIVMLTDEEDGSTRDCRYAERGVPCTDAVSVFDQMSPQWSSSDLNLRFYLYTPGSAQDPTWNIDRYISPMQPNRGFTSLKPGRPDLVTFSAIAGVPINLPTRMVGSATEVDWNTLLGTSPDGSDGYTAMSAEGPVSMRQRNMDPMCSTRVVPACRREGSTPVATCDSAAQAFAWPSRRVAQVVRRFDERYNNGSISSICRNDYAEALQGVARLIQRRLSSRCLPRDLPTVAAPCEAGDARGGCVVTRCTVREILPSGTSASTACVASRGRTPGGRDSSMRDTCVVNQLALPPGAAPPTGREGFYYDTRDDPAAPGCRRHIEFTSGAALLAGATATIECLDAPTPTPAPSACNGATPVGGACAPVRPGGMPCDASNTSGCFLGTEIYLETGSAACRSGACLAYRYDERSDTAGRERARRVHCTCRCGVPERLRASVPASALCACPTGFACGDIGAEAWPNELAGSYCVRSGS